jgi:hypothetical protein
MKIVALREIVHVYDMTDFNLGRVGELLYAFNRIG